MADSAGLWPPPPPPDGRWGWAYPEKLGPGGSLKVVSLVALSASIWLLGHAVIVGFYLPEGAPTDDQLAQSELSGEAIWVAALGLVIAVVTFMYSRSVNHRSARERSSLVVGALPALCVGAALAVPKHLAHVTSPWRAADSVWVHRPSREVAWATLMLGVVIGWVLVRGVFKSPQHNAVKVASVTLALVLTVLTTVSLYIASGKVAQARRWPVPGAVDELRLLVSDPIP